MRSPVSMVVKLYLKCATTYMRIIQATNGLSPFFFESLGITDGDKTASALMLFLNSGFCSMGISLHPIYKEEFRFS